MRSYRKRLGNVIVMFLCGVVTVLSCTMTTPAAVSREWGIKFESPGKKPKVDFSDEELKVYDAYYMGDGQDKFIYLTFDAGYENGLTDHILDILQKTDVPAAFFLVGHYIKRNPALVERMIEEGHIVANHTMTHPDIYALDNNEVSRKELASTEAVYREVTGLELSKFYRPPCGAFNKNNMRVAKDMGYKTIFWSLAYYDWDMHCQPSNWSAMKKLITCVHPGAVLLLHNTCPVNANILEELINQYKQMDYTFKRLDTLVKT